MVNLIADVTDDFLRDCLWSILGSKFLNEATAVGVDVDVDIDADGVPFFMMDTGRVDMDVDFQTRELEDKHGAAIGWEFIPVIHTDAVDAEYNLRTSDDLNQQFKVWSTVLDLCRQIYEIEFYPNDYIDETAVEDI